MGDVGGKNEKWGRMRKIDKFKFFIGTKPI